MIVKTTTCIGFFGLIGCVLLFPFSSLQAKTQSSTSDHSLFPSKTFYFGINMGGGSTEWKYLVDTTDQNPSGATPVNVSEGGPSWGAVIGYDVSKNFAIEAQYMQFADSNINMGPNSGYVQQTYNPILGNGNPVLGFVSQTAAYSLSGKFLAQLGHTHMRAFAAVGVGIVERTDPLVNYQAYPDNSPDQPQSNYTGANHTISCTTPYLSSGLVYSFTRHWMLESGFQYYTGFGKSEVYPVAGFIPFAWDAYGRIAYQL